MEFNPSEAKLIRIIEMNYIFKEKIISLPKFPIN